MLNTSYEDSKGNIWFGTYYGGLSKFDGKTFKNYTYEDKRHENPIWSICEDKLGNIWIGTTNGVHIFNGDHFTHLSGSEMLGAAPIWCIFKDNEHNLWIGTAENGLIKYDGHNFISYSFDTTLDKSTIFSIFQDSQNALWIGSKTSGLFRLDNTQFTQFSTDNGLSNNTVWSIQEDRKNRIWVTTENGLNLLCPSTELNSQKKISYKILQFEKRDGLAGVDFFLNSSLIDSKNTLWMGSGKALTSLNLNKFQLDTVKPKVYLRQIKLNGQHIDYRNSELKNFNYSEIEPFENYPLKLELPNDINHLTFFFSGIAWSTSHQLKYSYKIDRLNSFWSMPSSEAKADYRHLPSGNYTFRVKAKSNNGFWSESFVYQFKIDAPWWKSWWMFIGYFLIFILTFYSLLKWRTNSLIRRQKVLESEVFIATKKITAQKDAVEAANKDINESLRSAKRIQKAIFPSNELVKKYLPDSFVLYKPKDLVAGDFYWLEHKYDKLFFATADCTGHGVPGAMMSVVCNHGLNRSLREHNCTEPGDILNKTREIVISEFDQLEDEVQDGMDIALCSLEGRTLKYSGANIPLWLISDGVIIETTPDKQPIGNYLNQKPYTTYTIDIQTGDTLYLFTDGFADQFGGERGKKFKTRALRNLILAIYKKPMEEQRKILELTFESWKGELEQIDDVCIMGVRF